MVDGAAGQLDPVIAQLNTCTADGAAEKSVIVSQSGVMAPGTVDGAAEQSVIVIQSSVVAQDAADGAAEQSVIVANPEQSVVVSQSGELVQGAGHDEVPVEEQIFDGGP